MCGRYTLVAPGEEIARRFGLPEVPGLAPRYNIAPTQEVPVVREDDGARVLTMMRWGLVPSWAKDASIGNRMINARAETVHEKPAYRAAFKRRRCLVPATGFFEWKKVDKAKQPYLLSMKDGSVFAIAGLWEAWRGDDTPLTTMTLLTGTPNAVAAEVHDRMPIIVPEAGFATWLDPDADAKTLRALLVPYAADAMQAQPVSRAVNSPKNDTAACVEPLA